MSAFVDRPQPMSRADMATLERALRHGWQTPAETMREQLERVQAVLDDPTSHARARERAERIMQLAAGRLDPAPSGGNQTGAPLNGRA
jgi:hypothetical protein